MTFGAWVNKTRQHHGMTLDELASKAGVSKGSIWEIENGQDTKMSTAKKISEALGCEFWRGIRNSAMMKARKKK